MQGIVSNAAAHVEVVTIPSAATNRPGRPRPSSHAGPASPSRKAALAATSAAAPARATHRHLRPGRSRGAAEFSGRSGDAGARPLAATGAASCHWWRITTLHAHSVTAAETDVDRTTHHKVAAGRTKPPSSSRRTAARSTASDLTTPFRSSCTPAPSRRSRARRPQPAQGGDRRRGLAPVENGREVAVVPCADHRRTDPGIDETTRHLGGPEGKVEHLAMQRRHRAAARGVQPHELDPGLEAAERLVMEIEQGPHLRNRSRACSGHDNISKFIDRKAARLTRAPSRSRAAPAQWTGSPPRAGFAAPRRRTKRAARGSSLRACDGPGTARGRAPSWPRRRRCSSTRRPRTRRTRHRTLASRDVIARLRRIGVKQG